MRVITFLDEMSQVVSIVKFNSILHHDIGTSLSDHPRK